MTVYPLKIHKAVKKFLQSLSPNEQQRFKQKLDYLCENPYQHLKLDIKPLQGSGSLYRLRVGKYRLIYQIDESELIIFLMTAGSRGDVYK